jgi:drug/metabolite transporter (DMT)-like permease
MKKSILAGVGATACWGFSNVLSKSLLTHFEPLSLLAVQLVVSNIFLWLFLAFQDKSPLSRKESLKYSLPGLLQPGLAYTFGVFGLNLTTANSEVLIWTSETIVVIFLASLILREKISRHILLMAAGGICGTIIATNPPLDAQFSASAQFGNMLNLSGVVCAAFYSIYSQRQLIGIEPLRLTALHQLSGLILVICFWAISLPLLGFSRGINGYDFFLAIVSGITAHALPFVLYLVAMKEMGAAKTAIFLVLPPIFTIIGSFFFLGERLNYMQWIGALLALTAVSGICISRNTGAS